jgi:hypothetical protein
VDCCKTVILNEVKNLDRDYSRSIRVELALTLLLTYDKR